MLFSTWEGACHFVLELSTELVRKELLYTSQREALAAVAAIMELYPYLYGVPFQLMTDHNPLIVLKGLKDFGG